MMWDDTYKLMHGEQLHSGYAVADYPEWMDAKDRYESMCLGTNVMFAEAFKVRDSMITRLPDYNVMPMWVGLDKEIADATYGRPTRASPHNALYKHRHALL